MPNPDERRLTIRFTGEEYAALLQKSGGQPMAPFVHELALRRLSERRAKQVRTPLKDYVALARALAKLGTSLLVETFQRVSQDLQDGGSTISPSAEESLESIALELAEIKRLLMGALGVSEG